MPKQHQQWVIELDGLLYRYQTDRLEQFQDLKDLTGGYCFITDLQEGISRTATVETNAKYVEFMIRRRLQESGDFDEPVSVITHWKKKKGANSTDVLYTALSTRLYSQYMDRIRDDKDSVLFYPLYSFLYSVLARISAKEPVALVFQHGRFADLIIGNKKQIYHANRSVAFEASHESLEGLWGTVKMDVKVAENDFRIKISRLYTLSWVDSCPIPESLKEDACEIVPLEAASVFLAGEQLEASVLKEINRLKVSECASPMIEKLYYFSGKVLPWVILLFFVVTLILVGGNFYLRNETSKLRSEMHILEKGILDISEPTPPTLEPEFRDTLKFVRSLSDYRKAPPYKQVVNEISFAMTSDMRVEVLKLNYTEGRLNIELFGHIDAPFDVAQKGYARMVEAMRRHGYGIVENRFDTEIKTSQFLLKLDMQMR